MPSCHSYYTICDYLHTTNDAIDTTSTRLNFLRASFPLPKPCTPSYAPPVHSRSSPPPSQRLALNSTQSSIFPSILKLSCLPCPFYTSPRPSLRPPCSDGRSTPAWDHSPVSDLLSITSVPPLPTPMESPHTNIIQILLSYTKTTLSPIVLSQPDQLILAIFSSVNKTISNLSFLTLL